MWWDIGEPNNRLCHERHANHLPKKSKGKYIVPTCDDVLVLLIVD